MELLQADERDALLAQIPNLLRKHNRDLPTVANQIATRIGCTFKCSGRKFTRAMCVEHVKLDLATPERQLMWSLLI
jgi:hypothetical protein